MDACLKLVLLSRAKSLQNPFFGHLAHGAKSGPDIVDLPSAQVVGLTNVLDFLVGQHGTVLFLAAPCEIFSGRSRSRLQQCFLDFESGLPESVALVRLRLHKLDLVDVDATTIQWLGREITL